VSIGSAYSDTRGAPVAPSIGSAYSDTRGAAVEPSIGSAYFDTKGETLPDHVIGPMLEHAVAASPASPHVIGPMLGHVVATSPTSSVGPILEHLVFSFPGQSFSGVAAGSIVAIPPVRGFGGISNGFVPDTDGPTFGGVSAAIASSPPLRGYGGPSGGYIPSLTAPTYFGAGIGGEVFYDRLRSPENLTVTVIDAGCILLEWDDVSPDEDGFRAERSLTGAADWEEVGSVGENVTTFLDRFAVPLVVYDYQVIAFNSTEDSFPSNVVTAVTQLPPGISTSPPPVSPVDPPRNRLESDIVEFKSPGTSGLERDADGDVVGNKF
jgi:hypothetical protein